MKQYDVFISHATEDKDAIVRPLAIALAERGLDVWYDEFELRIGDSLRRKIDRGIANARFGVVVLSRAFFAKNWPQYELDGLVTREIHGGNQIILPLWHGLSKDELLRHSPSLADKVALRTSDLSVDQIADEVAAVILGDEAKAA
ncbi:MAG: toll/interleukin-1 receptor domain-containing protein [Thermoleophilaceae bacterium]